MDKMELGSMSSSSTGTDSCVEMDFVANISNNAKHTTIIKHNTSTPINKTARNDKLVKAENESTYDNVSKKPVKKFHEVLIKVENSVESVLTSQPLEILVKKSKSTMVDNKLNVKDQKEDLKTTTDNDESENSINMKEAGTELEDVEDMHPDNSRGSDSDADTTPNNGDEILIKISSTNAQDTSSPIKSKVFDLVWKYFEKIKKSSCKCKGCEQVFPCIKQVPLISHLKGKHPSFYNNFVRDQLLDLPVKLNTNIHVFFVFQYFKRISLFEALCKQCNAECSPKLSDITEHLKNYHPDLYKEYKNIKRIDLYERSQGPSLAKLKKTAVPSVFLEGKRPEKGSKLGYKKSNKIMNRTMDKVATDSRVKNEFEVPLTSNGGLSQKTEAESKIECRACLQNYDKSVAMYDLFQPWFLAWNGMESNVAADLAKIAKIQVSPSDIHTKFICHPCCVKLRNACEFTASVKRSDQILRLRCMQTGDQPNDDWPKPIKLDMSIDTTVMEVDIKQEVVSDSDCYNESAGDNDTSLPNLGFDPLDIKIEPEEILPQNPPDANFDGIPGDDFDPQTPGNIITDEPSGFLDNYSNIKIKDEPMSEEECVSSETSADLPLDCMLCSKVFHEVTGLKAHVIAQHSYKTVRRKTGRDSPLEGNRNEKYVCDICEQVFQTSTDLMVHETCHNKYKCFECNEKFDTFMDLTDHRGLCKAIKSKRMQKPKTLDDVRRPYSDSPTPEENPEPSHPMLRVKSSEELGSMSLHFQIHSVRSVADQEMETGKLHTSYSEDDSSFNNCYS